ncbi:site-specific integrase [Siccirubricoccus sp. KC 17139]|uniref:Site-specific integrase n=1 Tax=Siccirubricoccus soli TaxID=2899147 RepID=A0ABT1D199_9PROT|nr:site-specific integrase [Siccirubricoccus soli]MCO6415683.1 site-specific integrase [Siccirubricoccus soli]MCP2681815.1 site-specific integrase [Siccirubricoccus soli]
MNDLACRRAKPGSELHDGDNLVLRVGTRRKTWTLVWRQDGRVRKAALGTYPEIGLAAARAAAQEGIVRARAGFAPVAPPEPTTPALPPPRGTSVKAVLKTYITRHVRAESRDPDQIEWVADVLLAPIHERDATTLTRRDITKFLDTVADQRGGPSAYRAGSVLRAAFRFSVRRGDLENDPTHLIALPSSGKPRERILSDLELTAVWKSAVPVWSRLARVLLLTGLRLREAADAPVDEFQGEQWLIPAARMKGGRPHVVPMFPALQFQIGDLDGARWVFKSPRRFDQPVSGFSRGLELLQRESGTEGWTWHDLRRTTASGLQRLGCPHDVIEAILAHRKPGVAGIYQRHDFLPERRKWLARWAEHAQSVDRAKSVET